MHVTQVVRILIFVLPHWATIEAPGPNPVPAAATAADLSRQISAMYAQNFTVDPLAKPATVVLVKQGTLVRLESSTLIEFDVPGEHCTAHAVWIRPAYGPHRNKRLLVLREHLEYLGF